ncbi:hypothetical protein KAR91_77470 [Candidatus Pacearchaeota archaeon]|nr:hypothetical protein [Candidatus Pacearchaeota archaeon]
MKSVVITPNHSEYIDTLLSDKYCISASYKYFKLGDKRKSLGNRCNECIPDNNNRSLKFYNNFGNKILNSGIDWQDQLLYSITLTSTSSMSARQKSRYIDSLYGIMSRRFPGTYNSRILSIKNENRPAIIIFSELPNQLFEQEGIIEIATMDSIVQEVSLDRNNYKYIGRAKNASEDSPITPEQNMALRPVGTSIPVHSSAQEYYEIAEEFVDNSGITIRELIDHKTLQHLIVDNFIDCDNETRSFARRKMKVVIYNRNNFYGMATLESNHSNYGDNEPDANITYLDRIECIHCTAKHIEENMWDGMCQSCFLEGY